jgi:hypothetical protein
MRPSTTTPVGRPDDSRRRTVHSMVGTLNARRPARLGYPALILDPRGPAVDVHVFESPDLSAHWSSLDDFEGSGYRRVVTTVRTPGR